MQRAKTTKRQPRESWKKDWEPIFRAAREGRLPNRMLGVMETQACICALRTARIVPRHKESPR